MKKHIIFALIFTISANYIFSEENTQWSFEEVMHQWDGMFKDKKHYRVISIMVNELPQLHDYLQGCYTQHPSSSEINMYYKKKCKKALAVINEIGEYKSHFSFSFCASLNNTKLTALQGNVHGITQNQVDDMKEYQKKKWNEKWQKSSKKIKELMSLDALWDYNFDGKNI